MVRWGHWASEIGISDPCGWGRSRKPILRSNPIFPPQVPPSACSMAPLFLPLLAALALAPVPAALADALEGDSSGKQCHSGSLSTSCIAPAVESGFLFSPNRPLPASGDPWRRWNREHCGEGSGQGRLKIGDDLGAPDRVVESWE